MNTTPYEVTSLEQMKALSHMLRVKVLGLFHDNAPRTAKQIADELGIPKSKVHYHVKELHRVGLLELVETKEKGGVIEKYYLPISTNLRIRPPENVEYNAERLEAQRQVGMAMLDDYVEAYRQSIEQNQHRVDENSKPLYTPSSTSGYLYLTQEQKQECARELVELIDRWAEQFGQPNEEGTSEMWQVVTSIFKKPE